MKDFINEDFLLQSDVAKMLYHEHAEKMPIIDYHCHLNPKMIADDYKFSSIMAWRRPLQMACDACQWGR